MEVWRPFLSVTQKEAKDGIDVVGEEEGRWRAEGGERGEGGEEKRGEVSERERESLEGKDFLKVRVGGVESPSGGSF